MKTWLALLPLLLLGSCLQKKSRIGNDFLGAAGSFTMEIPFDAGTQSSYLFNDIAYSANMTLELLSGRVRLKLSGQTDDATTSGAGSGGFQDGTLLGVQWDDTNGYLRLDSTTNTAELEESWAPEWASVVGYWRFNEAAGSATVADDSPGASYAATVGAGVTLGGTGQLNGSADLPGAAGAEIITGTGPGLTTAGTVALWVNVASFNGDGIVMHQGPAGSESFSILATGDTFSATAYWDDATSTTVSAAALAGQWYHVALAYDGSELVLYLNGHRADGAAAVGKTFATPANSQVGFGIYTDAGNHFIGGVDEAALWDAGLDADEVHALYERQSPVHAGLLTSRVMDGFASQSWSSLAMLTTLPFHKPLSTSAEDTSATGGYLELSGDLASGLTHLWRFDETAGAVAADAVGGLDGTLANSPGLDQPGRFNRAIRLDRASVDHVEIPTHDLGNQFTLSFWAKINRTTTLWHTLASNSGSGSAADGFRIGLNTWTTGDGRVSLETGNGVAGNAATTPVGLATPSVWHHYAFVVDRTAGTAQIWVDGVRSSTDETIRTDFNTSGVIRFGATLNNAGPFDGLLDEAATWSRALDADEVRQLYRRGANRLRYQVRSCANDDCSDQNASPNLGWKGPDDTAASWFSELHNTTNNVQGDAPLATSPTMTFANFTTAPLVVADNRYFQYRVALENDDAGTAVCSYDAVASACSPELRSVVVGPAHYDSTARTITTKASLGRAYVLLDSFEETGTTDCTEGVRYALSADGDDFHYWDGSSWTASAGYATASDAATINDHIASFPTQVGRGTLRVKAYLKSDGESACALEGIKVTGRNY